MKRPVHCDVIAGPHVGIVGTILALSVDRHVWEVTAYRLLTGLTPAETELEVIHDLRSLLEEGHVVDLPAESHGGEYTPTVLLGETGSTIVTDCEGKEVGILERVVQTTEERDEHQVATIIGENRAGCQTDFGFGSGVDLKLAAVVGGVLEAGSSEDSTVVSVLIVETLPGVTCHYVKVRLDSLEFLLIVEIEVKKGIAVEVVVFIISTGTVLVGRFLPCGRRVLGKGVVVLRLCHVITEVKVEVKFRKEVEGVVDLEVAVRTPYVAVVVVVVEHGHGVE